MRDATRLQDEASNEIRDVVGRMRDEGLTMRDIAVLLGYLVYYSYMGTIVNRPKYVTDLGKLIVFPSENHWILNPENSKFHYQEVGNWLSTYLK